MVEVKYKNTEEQWINFSIYKMNSSKSHEKSVKMRKSLVIALGFFIGILYFVLAFQEYNQGKSPSFSIILALIFISLGIIGYFYLPIFWSKITRKSLKETFKENEKDLGRTIVVTLDKQTLIVAKKKDKVELPLNSIIDITEINECICISVEGNPGIMVPYEAFESEADRITFENTVKVYVNKEMEEAV